MILPSPPAQYDANDQAQMREIIMLEDARNAKRSRSKQQTLTYGATIATDVSRGASTYVITATNGTAFTISAPSNGLPGQRIKYLIRNASGGALGAVTWNAVFKMAAWTSPANGNSRSIFFEYDGTNWVEDVRSTADVPN